MEIELSINEEYEIQEVQVIPGNQCFSGWKRDMQLVITDKGEYISKVCNDGGYDWTKKIGKKVDADIKTDQHGCKWINLRTNNEKTNKGKIVRQIHTQKEELPKDYDINKNPELKHTYDLIKNGVPVIFLTGGAGTGKSTFIKFIKNNYREETGKNCIVLAYTGVAALNVGGQTIHAFFNFPFDPFDNKKITKSKKNPIIDNIDLIIIDEISMVRSCMIDHIDYALKLWCGNQKPFGGKQLLLIGDCFQLPPITNKANSDAMSFYAKWENPFFFAAKIFEAVEIKAFQLTKIYRQENDLEFMNMLNRIRECKNGYKEDIEKLNNTCLVEKKGRIPEDCLLLSTRNDMANKHNKEKLNKLLEKRVAFKRYNGFIEGRFLADDKMERFITPKELELCIGARIMVTKNINSQGLVNGDIGEVIGFGGDGNSNDDYVDIIVKGNKYHLTRETWQRFNYIWDEKSKTIQQEIIGTFTQIPLRLGWAVTIHKSQGLTLDSVAIDAPSAWDPGQIYVALSRAKNLDGVYLCQKINPSSVKTDNYVVKKYNELFSEKNNHSSYSVEKHETIKTDNKTNNSVVIIGDIEFKLYPKNQFEKHAWKNFVQNTMTLLLTKNLIPENEMVKLINNVNYCYKTFGINWNHQYFTLLKQNREDCYDSEGHSRYWAEKCGDYYVCSQWTIKYSRNLANWLINLAEGNLS